MDIMSQIAFVLYYAIFKNESMNPQISLILYFRSLQVQYLAL